MVNEIVAPEKLAERAVEFAAEIAANAPLSLTGNKRVIGELLAAEGRLDPDGRGGARRAARGLLPQRGLLRRSARVRREASSGMAGTVRAALAALVALALLPAARAGGGPAARRRAAPARGLRLRDLGPGAEADAEPRLATLGHAQARRHHVRSSCASTATPTPTRRGSWSATCRAAAAASSARATAGSATRRTRAGSTSTSTTPAATASSAPRGGPARSTARSRRSSSTASSRAGATKVYVGPNVRLSGRRGVVTPLVYHDDHLHVRLSPRRVNQPVAG